MINLRFCVLILTLVKFNLAFHLFQDPPTYIRESIDGIATGSLPIHDHFSVNTVRKIQRVTLTFINLSGIKPIVDDTVVGSTLFESITTIGTNKVILEYILTKNNNTSLDLPFSYDFFANEEYLKETSPYQYRMGHFFPSRELIWIHRYRYLISRPEIAVNVELFNSKNKPLLSRPFKIVLDRETMNWLLRALNPPDKYETMNWSFRPKNKSRYPPLKDVELKKGDLVIFDEKNDMETTTLTLSTQATGFGLPAYHITFSNTNTNNILFENENPVYLYLARNKYQVPVLNTENAFKVPLLIKQHEWEWDNKIKGKMGYLETLNLPYEISEVTVNTVMETTKNRRFLINGKLTYPITEYNHAFLYDPKDNKILGRADLVGNKVYEKLLKDKLQPSAYLSDVGTQVIGDENDPDTCTYSSHYKLNLSPQSTAMNVIIAAGIGSSDNKNRPTRNQHQKDIPYLDLDVSRDLNSVQYLEKTHLDRDCAGRKSFVIDAVTGTVGIRYAPYKLYLYNMIAAGYPAFTNQREPMVIWQPEERADSQTKTPSRFVFNKPAFEITPLMGSDIVLGTAAFDKIRGSVSVVVKQGQVPLKASNNKNRTIQVVLSDDFELGSILQSKSELYLETVDKRMVKVSGIDFMENRRGFVDTNYKFTHVDVEFVTLRVGKDRMEISTKFIKSTRFSSQLGRDFLDDIMINSDKDYGP